MMLEDFHASSKLVAADTCMSVHTVCRKNSGSTQGCISHYILLAALVSAPHWLCVARHALNVSSQASFNHLSTVNRL